MKKLTLIALLVLLTATTAFAQSKAKERREARLKANEKEYNAVLVKAIEQSSFSFTAEYWSLNIGENYPITGPYQLFFINGKELRVLLPYTSSSQPSAVTPQSFDFSTTDFTYKVTITKSGMYKVNIVANNVINNQAYDKTQNHKYVFNFEISAVTGRSFLTITPNYSAPITYTGSTSANVATSN